MPVLIVSATALESNTVAQLPKGTVHILNTGVGMLNSAYHVTKALSRLHFDFVMNIGICGSYVKNFAIGDILHIDEEIFSDLGASDADGNFLDLKAMGFTLFENNDSTYFNAITSPHRLSDFFEFDFSNIPSVKSTSVNTVNGHASAIERVLKQFVPQVENMEGGAIAYVCLQENVPYFEFRSISNYVEPRDKAAWNIPLAVRNIQDFAVQLLQHTKFKI